MAPTPENSIWKLMNYTPPRGQCNHKASLMSPKCSCLRFMLHPMNVSSSFECDGCGHHASFHSMENKSEDEIIKRWAVEQREEEQNQNENGHPRKRRRRAIEAAPVQATVSLTEAIRPSQSSGTELTVAELRLMGLMGLPGPVNGRTSDTRAQEIVDLSGASESDPEDVVREMPKRRGRPRPRKLP